MKFSRVSTSYKSPYFIKKLCQVLKNYLNKSLSLTKMKGTLKIWGMREKWGKM